VCTARKSHLSLSNSTKYVVTVLHYCCYVNHLQVPAAASSIGNEPLGKDFAFEFLSPTVKILQVLPLSNTHNVKLNPIIFVAFDQRMAPEDVIKATECFTTEKKVKKQYSLSAVDPTTLSPDSLVATAIATHRSGYYVTLQSRFSMRP
jgi:hypothetical protein